MAWVACLECNGKATTPRIRSVLLVGAGGAGRAIAFAVASAGARTLTIFDIDELRADDLAKSVAAATNCRTAVWRRPIHAIRNHYQCHATRHERRRCPARGSAIGWSLAASSWTSSIRQNRRPFAVPPERVVVAPKADARCTKDRPCMPCASLASITSPKEGSAPDMRLRTAWAPVPDPAIGTGKSPTTTTSLNEWMENDMTRHFLKAVATAAFCVIGFSATVAQAQDKWDSAPWIEGKAGHLQGRLQHGQTVSSWSRDRTIRQPSR